MGWASGSDLARELWAAVEGYIPIDERAAVADQFVESFQGMDCDTLEEIEGPIGWRSRHRNLVQDGAPEEPTMGEIFEIPPEDAWVWDGQKWIWFTRGGVVPKVRAEDP